MNVGGIHTLADQLALQGGRKVDVNRFPVRAGNSLKVPRKIVFKLRPNLITAFAYAGADGNLKVGGSG